MPAAADEFAFDTAGDDEGFSAGKAELSSMGMSAELETKTEACGFSEYFRAMGEEDAEGIWRHLVAKAGEIVCFVEVRIVDSSDPKAIFSPLDACGFVKENREAIRFKRGDHFQKVVITEDAPALRGEGGCDPGHFAEAGSVVTAPFISEVTGDDCRIVRGFPCETLDDWREGHIQIEVQVAHLQEPKAFKSPWQPG